MRKRALHEGGEKCIVAFALAARKKTPTCDGCFFRQNMLCALELDEPCPTWREADRGLAPERQLAFVFRTERTTSAYAFPQPAASR